MANIQRGNPLSSPPHFAGQRVEKEWAVLEAAQPVNMKPAEGNFGFWRRLINSLLHDPAGKTL